MLFYLNKKFYNLSDFILRNYIYKLRENSVHFPFKVIQAASF